MLLIDCIMMTTSQVDSRLHTLLDYKTPERTLTRLESKALRLFTVNECLQGTHKHRGDSLDNSGGSKKTESYSNTYSLE